MLRLFKINIFICIALFAVLSSSCSKSSNELKWPKKLNQPSSLTHKLWTQDTLNSLGNIEFIEFLAEPENAIKFTRYGGTSYYKYNWSYYAEQNIIAFNDYVFFTYYDIIMGTNTFTITINEIEYDFYNYP
jgi:hypothetical protein